jgi:hypothetical protein
MLVGHDLEVPARHFLPNYPRYGRLLSQFQSLSLHMIWVAGLRGAEQESPEHRRVRILHRLLHGLPQRSQGPTLVVDHPQTDYVLMTLSMTADGDGLVRRTDG